MRARRDIERHIRSQLCAPFVHGWCVGFRAASYAFYTLDTKSFLFLCFAIADPHFTSHSPLSRRSGRRTVSRTPSDVLLYNARFTHEQSLSNGGFYALGRGERGCVEASRKLERLQNDCKMIENCFQGIIGNSSRNESSRGG